MTFSQEFNHQKTIIERNIIAALEAVLKRELTPELALAVSLKAQTLHKTREEFSSVQEVLPITILVQRRVELEVIRYFYSILMKDLGPSQAQAIIGQAIINDARAAGQQKAISQGGPTDLATFAEILPLWTSGGALEMKVLESTPNHLHYVVTRCRYAEMYRELGLGDLGFLVSCGRDGAFMEGYAPQMALDRVKTIMTGDPTCEFVYHLAEQ